MVWPLLTAADYPTIRGAIDPGLDATALPDATIALPIYEPAAEAEVLALDPLAPTRSAQAQVDALKRAAALLTAARFVPVLQRVAQEKFAQDYAVQYADVDLEARAAELRGMAYAAVASAKGADAMVATRPTLFAAASAPRPHRRLAWP